MSRPTPPARRRAHPLRVLPVVCLLLLAACGERRRPNVIVLVIDTLRADHLSGYGYPRPTTPNLDRLMVRGVRFDQAIALSSWSAPSHVSIITGTRDDHHQVLNWGQRIRSGVVPLAVPLKASGYATGLFSTHLALHNSVQRIDEGIEEKLVLDNRQDARVLPAATDWALRQTRPFFLYACVMGPHAPYDKYPPEDDTRHFTDVPPGGERSFPFVDQDEWIGEGGIPGSVRLEDRHDVGYYVNRYDRAIRYTDQLVGELLDRLDAAGRLDDTLIVVTSDHGEGFGDHDCFAHELYLYDFLVRVPLIVAWPRRIPPGVWPGQVSSMDIVPTVLGAARVPAPPRIDGIDLSQWLIDAKRPPQSRLAFASYRSRGFDRYMARSDRYKLILDKQRRHEELYDLSVDPTEQHNLLERRGVTFPEAAYVGLRANLLTYLSGHREANADLPASFRDPKVLAELRALGYVGASVPQAANPAADPERDRK